MMLTRSLPVPEFIKNTVSGTHFLYLGLLWMFGLFILPIVLLAVDSLNMSGNGGFFKVYRTALSSVYIDTIIRSFYYGLVVMAVCIALAYSLSYFIVFRAVYERLLLALVIIPFWVAYVVRYIGIQIALSPNSPLVQLFGTDFGLLFSTGGVVLGLTSILLPFAVLPIYNSLSSIDNELVQASRVLGASQFRTVHKVILPLSLSGVVAGAIIVFILASGSFLAPAILGGPNNTMIANLIQNAYSVHFNVELAAALAIIYTIILTVLLFLVNSFIRLDEVLGNL